MSQYTVRIAENVARVRESIAQAAERSGRDANDVHLIAVSKYVDAQVIEALVEAGCTNLGESRPQVLWQKAEQLAHLPIRWHMIGHLQRNKARRTVSLLDFLHAGDSLRLLRTVDAESAEASRVTDVLLEINVSGDEAKHGFLPEQAAEALRQLVDLKSLRVRGLMAMAGWGTSPAEARHDFVRLRELRDSLAASIPPEVSLDQLSMGMSGDFEVAIEEGATMVRVGSALFEGIDR